VADEEITDRSPPIALFLSGESFLISARHLDAAVEAKALRLRFEMPIYYLYSHAVELVLKSFLRAKGLTADNLKDRFGHGLVRLYGACRERGLILNPIAAAIVDDMVAMLADLGRNHEFRYVTTGAKTYPTLPAVRDICEALFVAVRPIVMATVNGPIPERP
jgi:hypothetical protein